MNNVTHNIFYIFIYIFKLSTCFEHIVHIIRRDKLCQYNLWQKNIFSKLTKRSTTFPFLRLGKHGSHINYRHLPVFSSFSKLLRFVILERGLCCLKFKLIIFQHFFTKSKCAITKLLNCFDFLVSFTTNAIYLVF